MIHGWFDCLQRRTTGATISCLRLIGCTAIIISECGGIIPESLSEFEVIHCIGKPCGLLARLHHVVLYYMSKHAPWMNQVEIWLSILVRKLLKHGNSRSLDDLRDHILAFSA